MSSIEQQISDILKCPICYKIPRVVPIRNCEAGHIICEECRPQVLVCPTCRGPFADTTNNVVDSISQILLHPCKYATFGCNMKMKADEIENHEKDCFERTIYCCFRGDTVKIRLSNDNN